MFKSVTHAIESAQQEASHVDKMDLSDYGLKHFPEELSKWIIY